MTTMTGPTVEDLAQDLQRLIQDSEDYQQAAGRQAVLLAKLGGLQAGQNGGGGGSNLLSPNTANHHRPRRNFFWFFRALSLTPTAAPALSRESPLLSGKFSGMLSSRSFRVPCRSFASTCKCFLNLTAIADF